MWDPRPAGVFQGAQYVGLVHDPSRLQDVPGYYTASKQASPYLLGFNEPDLPGGTAVSVSQAVSYWRQYFNPLKAYGTLLGAPAVTNSVQAGQGIQWLQQFVAACPDCKFDLIPIHWYGYTLSDFQNYIINFHNQFPAYPIWVTEFTFPDHDQQSVAALVRSSIQWMDTQPYIQRYSLFGPMTGARMAGVTPSAAMVSDDSSSLTIVGKVYDGQA